MKNVPGMWSANGNVTLTAIDGANPKAVLTVGNTIFAGDTDKKIPVTLTIPTTVSVEAGAFMGLTNLTKITIKPVKKLSSSDLQYDIHIGENAFFGCFNVKTFEASALINLKVNGVTYGKDEFETFKIKTGLIVDGLERS